MIIDSVYRPFTKKQLYFSRELNEMQYLLRQIFGDSGVLQNKTIYLSGVPASKPFGCLATSTIAGFDFIEKTQCLPLYRYDKSGHRIENISDWALNLFRERYQVFVAIEEELTSMSDIELLTFTKNKLITKEDIFHYTYAILYNPIYRKKYELDLKREFPRLPLYDDFYQWAKWGKQLMDLHINYETVQPYPLKLIETTAEIKETKQNALFNMAQEPEALYRTQSKIKVKLKAHKAAGIIELDEQTALSEIPKQAWDYKLGNRSALEWVLDQYKEKKHADATIAEKFNTYRFANYKEQVIDLLKRVCTVSVETMKIVGEMEKAKF